MAADPLPENEVAAATEFKIREFITAVVWKMFVLNASGDEMVIFKNK